MITTALHGLRRSAIKPAVRSLMLAIELPCAEGGGAIVVQGLLFVVYLVDGPRNLLARRLHGCLTLMLSRDQQEQDRE